MNKSKRRHTITKLLKTSDKRQKQPEKKDVFAYRETKIKNESIVVVGNNASQKQLK
jgi:hypothetical protein